MAIKINPITGKLNLWNSNKPSTWNENSNLNDYTKCGVYHFTGFRLNNSDNLPIENFGSNTNVAFTLIVDTAKGFISNTSHIPEHISQTLLLGNRQGSETKIFVRNATLFYDNQPTRWEAWREIVASTYLGIADSLTSELLASATEIGLYTGAIVDTANSTFDVFKLEVINNHSLADQLGAYNSILQTITLLKIDTTTTSLQRFGIYDGEKFVFTKWKDTHAVDFSRARQDELGLVKGGQNVLIDSDGSMNVTQIINEIVDDSTDGILASSLLKINQNNTIEEAVHNYKDRGAKETITEQAERRINSVILCTADSSERDYNYISATEDLLPNTSKVVIADIWLKALNQFFELAKTEYKHFLHLQRLRTGLLKYPYYAGRYEFYLTLENALSDAYSIMLKSKDGHIETYFSKTDNSRRYFKAVISDFSNNDLSKILPLYIEIKNLHNSTYTYTGCQLEIHSWQKGTTEVIDDNASRYLYGEFQKSVVTENGYQDYTKNIALCRDGLLIQGRNARLYFKVNEEGYIETNINEIL